MSVGEMGGAVDTPLNLGKRKEVTLDWQKNREAVNLMRIREDTGMRSKES